MWGWLDFGEDAIQWIKRELQEEIWWDVISITTNPYVFLTTKCLNWPHKDNRIANIFYEVVTDNTIMKNSDECVEVRFVSPQEALKLSDRTWMIHTFSHYLLETS